MSASAAPDTTSPSDLEDAREALAYWEARAAGLPRLAVRDRREAREMAVRSRAWVTEAERALYGPGLPGALLLIASELRLPESARHAGRQAARRGRQAAVVVAATVVVALLATLAVLVALLAVLAGALT